MPIAQITTLLLLVTAFSTLHELSRRTVAADAGAHAHRPVVAAELPTILANDNRTPAGTLRDGVLTLDLRGADGLLRPSGEGGPELRLAAFGADSSPLTVPAPLIRVPSGTVIAASVRNDFPVLLQLHGLCERGAGACAPLDVPSGETRHVRFTSGAPGTYHYWGSLTGMPQQFRASIDTQLSGAFIVDPAGTPSADDRVFVITEWTSLTTDQLRHVASQDDPGEAFLKLRPAILFLINGRAWPHTERLEYERGKRVQWRIVNLSTQAHPMHLHGFYFQVESTGDGKRDRIIDLPNRSSVVTQLMPPGSTMAMSWMPERVGNWLFHCHVMTHVSPLLYVDGSPRPHDSHDHGLDGAAGMTGMVLGVTVVSFDESSPTLLGKPSPARRLSLQMESVADVFGDAPAYGFALAPTAAEFASDRVQVPGPTLVLTRGEPVEITLVNRLPEATAIHWHGMELDSYYDGVHGWSGTGSQVTPMIPEGGTFIVRFTPPRTGTFMYHTHLHDRRQLTSGLYGAMLVVEPGETFDEATDHVFVLARGGPSLDAPVVINSDRAPQTVWTAGVRHRIRLINITPDDIFSVALQGIEGPVSWVPVTKDGSPLPTDRLRPALAQQTIAVGETYDFFYDAPQGRRNLWLEVKSPAGQWQAQGHVIVR